MIVLKNTRNTLLTFRKLKLEIVEDIPTLCDKNIHFQIHSIFSKLFKFKLYYTAILPCLQKTLF